MTPAEEKELRKKRLRLRMFYILIVLTALMGAYLVYEVLSITILK